MDKENFKIENHPFKPFLPEGCKVVLCGTFPPKPDKWAMDFFYPNFYNDMWRIFGMIFFDNKEIFFDKTAKTIDKNGIQALLTKEKIGIGETVTRAIRKKDNASDKFLEVVSKVDLGNLFNEIPYCNNLVTTGEKAASVIAELTDTKIPEIGEFVECEINDGKIGKKQFKHWRMPSTSRAYPMSVEKKAEFYRKMFKETGVL